MKNVLVIGASGSLGKGVIEEIKGKFNITGTYVTRPLEIDGVKSIKLDITNKTTFKDISSNFDAVFFVAGAMPAMMNGYEPQRYIDVNVTGVLNVLEFCRINNIPKLIYVMTFSDAAGSFYNAIPIQDDGPRTLNLVGDHAVYSISKVAACDLIEHYHQQYGLQSIIFRIPTVYCNDDNFTYYVDGVLRTKSYIQMIKSIVNENKIEIWGDPANAKDMPYIKDFSILISKALENKNAQGYYNAGTATPISLNELVDVMIEVFGEDSGTVVKKIFEPDKPSQPNFTFDMDKTKQTFAYTPKFSLKDMMIDIRDSLGIDIFKEN